MSVIAMTALASAAVSSAVADAVQAALDTLDAKGAQQGTIVLGKRADGSFVVGRPLEYTKPDVRASVPTMSNDGVTIARDVIVEPAEAAEEKPTAALVAF